MSLTPILVAVELGFLLALAVRGARLSEQLRAAWPVILYVAWLAAYAVITSVLGAEGVYLREDVLRLYPGFWLQLVTVAVALVPLLLFGSLRQLAREVVDRTPLHWFAWFHGLRIGALGTAYKTAIGEFPAYFEYLVGVPDLLFGLSALWVAERLRRGRMGERGFLLWNLIGALIIVPSAPILIQLGLPGPLQLFTAQPDARAIMTYPMSIAPMIGVPLFVLINLWVAWRLWERGNETARHA